MQISPKLNLIFFFVSVSRIVAICENADTIKNQTSEEDIYVPKILHRQKRNPVFPEGSSIGCKWSLSFSLRSLRKISASVQITHQVKIPVSRIYPENEIKRKDQYDVEYLGVNENQNIWEAFPQNFSNIRSETYYNSVGKIDDTNELILKEERLDRLKSREDRLIFFKDILSLIEKMGLPPQACLLRLICEVGHMPENNSLFGELLLLLMRPSIGGQTEYLHEDKTYDEYVEAELYGRNVGKCYSKYKRCPASPLFFAYNLLKDLFSS